MIEPGIGSIAKAAEAAAMDVRSAAAIVFIVFALELFNRTVRFDELDMAHTDLVCNSPLRTIELIGSVGTLGIRGDT